MGSTKNEHEVSFCMCDNGSYTPKKIITSRKRKREEEEEDEYIFHEEYQTCADGPLSKAMEKRREFKNSSSFISSQMNLCQIKCSKSANTYWELKTQTTNHQSLHNSSRAKRKKEKKREYILDSDCNQIDSSLNAKGKKDDALGFVEETEKLLLYNDTSVKKKKKSKNNAECCQNEVVDYTELSDFLLTEKKEKKHKNHGIEFCRDGTVDGAKPDDYSIKKKKKKEKSDLDYSQGKTVNQTELSYSSVKKQKYKETSDELSQGDSVDTTHDNSTGISFQTAISDQTDLNDSAVKKKHQNKETSQIMKNKIFDNTDLEQRPLKKLKKKKRHKGDELSQDDLLDMTDLSVQKQRKKYRNDTEIQDQPCDQTHLDDTSVKKKKKKKHKESLILNEIEMLENPDLQEQNDVSVTRKKKKNESYKGVVDASLVQINPNYSSPKKKKKKDWLKEFSVLNEDKVLEETSGERKKKTKLSDVKYQQGETLDQSELNDILKERKIKKHKETHLELNLGDTLDTTEHNKIPKKKRQKKSKKSKEVLNTSDLTDLTLISPSSKKKRKEKKVECNQHNMAANYLSFTSDQHDCIDLTIDESNGKSIPEHAVNKPASCDTFKTEKRKEKRNAEASNFEVTESHDDPEQKEEVETKNLETFLDQFCEQLLETLLDDSAGPLTNERRKRVAQKIEEITLDSDDTTAGDARRKVKKKKKDRQWKDDDNKDQLSGDSELIRESLAPATVTRQSDSVIATLKSVDILSSNSSTADSLSEAGEMYNCEVCDKEFRRRKDLQRHLTTHWDWNCDLSFPSTSGLQKHSRSHEDDHEISTSPLESTVISASANPSLADVPSTGRKKYICEICDEEFPIRADFQIHHQTHFSGSEQDLSCELSDKKLPNQDLSFLCKHNYLCIDCSRSFKSQHLLLRHTRAHENVHKCEFCGKEFQGSSGLKNHLVSHSKERPFKCEYCEGAFKTKRTFQNHISKHTRPDFRPRRNRDTPKPEKPKAIRKPKNGLLLRPLDNAAVQHDVPVNHNGDLLYSFLRCPIKGCGAKFSYLEAQQMHFWAVHLENLDSDYTVQEPLKVVENTGEVNSSNAQRNVQENVYECTGCSRIYCGTEKLRCHLCMLSNKKARIFLPYARKNRGGETLPLHCFSTPYYDNIEQLLKN